MHRLTLTLTHTLLAESKSVFLSSPPRFSPRFRSRHYADSRARAAYTRLANNNATRRTSKRETDIEGFLPRMITTAFSCIASYKDEPGFPARSLLFCSVLFFPNLPSYRAHLTIENTPIINPHPINTQTQLDSRHHV